MDVLAEEEGDDIDMDGDLGPETQIVTTGCWLTMKEAALVIGKIADHAPQEGNLSFLRLKASLHQ